MGRPQDYSKSVIYHIRCIDTKNIIYVGSTTNFDVRKRSHKNVSKNENDKHYNLPLYYYIRENGGFECFEVIPVSYIKLENKVQLLIEEQKEMDKYNILLNKYFLFPSIQHKKELKKKHDVVYRKKHIDEIKKQKKMYYEEHKEEISEKAKVCRRQNGDKLLEPLECSKCKCITSKKHLARHQKSVKCKKIFEGLVK